jgi:membrane associated rhomboid family serine protease
MLPLFDNIPTRRFPLVTYALIAANFAVWLWGSVRVRGASTTTRSIRAR